MASVPVHLCVFGDAFVQLAGAHVGVYAAARQLNARALPGSLAPGELEKIGECNDRFIITESCVQHYSAPTVCRRQSSYNFC